MYPSTAQLNSTEAITTSFGSYPTKQAESSRIEPWWSQEMWLVVIQLQFSLHSFCRTSVKLYNRHSMNQRNLLGSANVHLLVINVELSQLNWVFSFIQLGCDLSRQFGSNCKLSHSLGSHTLMLAELNSIYPSKRFDAQTCQSYESFIVFARHTQLNNAFR